MLFYIKVISDLTELSNKQTNKLPLTPTLFNTLFTHLHLFKPQKTQKTQKNMSCVSPIVSSFPTDNGNVVAPTDEIDRALQNIVVKPKRSKKNKDPNAPKRPLAAYMLWLNDNRAKIAEEFFPDLSGKERVTNTAKKAGELWNLMTDEEKTPYNEQSEIARAEYHKLKAEYVPTEGFIPTKTSRTSTKQHIDHIPDAPEEWSGAFKMKYLKGKVKDAEGATIKIVKTFDDAVLLAQETNNSWTTRCADSDCPSHWTTNYKPCSGITKTARGYDLRAGLDLLTTDTKHTNSGIASWIFGKYSAPTATSETETKKSPTETETKTEKSPTETETKAKKPSPKAKKPSSKAKKSPTETKKSPTEAKKKVVIKKKKTVAKPVSKFPLDQYEEIEIERDGKDVKLMFHEESGEAFNTDNLLEPVGRVEDEEMVYF